MKKRSLFFSLPDMIYLFSCPGINSQGKNHLKRKILPILFTLALFASNVMQAQILTPGMDAVETHYGLNSTSYVAEVKEIGNQIGVTKGVNWLAPVISPSNWTAGNIGQVFGTAIDDAGNVYFATTAMYWRNNNPLNYVPQRLALSTVPVIGAGGDGFHLSGGAAGIYKANSANLNNVTVLTGTVPLGGGLNTKTIPNGGYGIGNIAYAKGINKLYASNLEDGKIYCIDLANGPNNGFITDVFDPFGPDASGAEIADYGERIFGLAVNYELTETRLYYAVLMNRSQSQIWSIKINNIDGSIIPNTNSLEIIVPQSWDLTYISDIAFSYRGEMLIAEKGAPHNANVYQYFGKHNAWSSFKQLYMASWDTHQNSAGGVDYGCSSKDSSNTQFFCDTIIWTQANAIQNTIGQLSAYGLLSHPLNDYVSPGAPPFNYLNQAYVVDIDGVTGPTNEKGWFGDVEYYDCQCPPQQTDICGKVDAKLTRIDTGECCYKVEISNKYRSDYFTAISITSHNLSIHDVSKDITSTWANITYTSPTQVVFTVRPNTNVPIDTLGLYRLLGTVCFTGSGPDNITVGFIGNPPQYDTVCTKIEQIEGCSIPIDTNCVAVLDLKAECISGAIKMKFRIKNNSNYTMRGLTIYTQTPGVTPSPKFIPIPDLSPGNTSLSDIETNLIISNNLTHACFFIEACDQNTTPGISGPYPYWCCMDRILYCVDIPYCDPCDALSISPTPINIESDNCCYKLTLSSNYQNANITYLEFIGVGGTQFALLSGWSIIPPVGSSHIKMKAPGAGVIPGVYPDFASFCLTGPSTSPHIILVKFIDAKGTLLCTDTLRFECKLVEPTCANIINDSLYCVGNQRMYTFYVKNNAPFPLYHIDFRTPGNVVLDKTYIEPNPPIAQGSIGGPYTVTIDSVDKDVDFFCMYLSGHNSIYDSIHAATECCTDSLGGICLPMIKCGCDTTICCRFENLIIPNGITPNEDGINDIFVIKNPECCEYISIKVYNRWGNLVFKDGDYKNDWKGVNQHGDKLVQGTYFVIIELPTGNKKGTYLDIRY